MARAFLSGLRGRLLLLVILATVPAFGLSFYSSWHERQHEVAAAVADTVRLARLLANDQERVIEGTRQILSDLSGIPEVRAGDAMRTRTLFALLMKQWRGYASFTLIDPAGQPIVSLPAVPGPLDLSQRSWFQRAVSTRQFSVGEYQRGPVTGRQIVVAAWPVVEGGKVLSVIAAALDVDWLNQIAAEAQLPAGSILQIVDRSGVLVARHPAAPGALGRQPTESAVVEGMRSRDEGSLELDGPDGTRRVYAFTPVRGRLDTGLRLVIGVPRAAAYGAIDRHQARQVYALLLLALLTLAFSWMGAERFVLRPVGSLLDATRKLAAGDPAARTSVPYGHGELSDLARAFDEMATALQAREEERQQAERALRESEDRFRVFMENTPAIAFVKDESGRCLYANAAFERHFELTRDQWFGRTIEEMWPSSPVTEALRRDDLRVLATNQPHQILETVPAPNGRPAYWMTVKFPLTDGSGRRLIGGVSVDLTEWRLAQAALARSERRYEQLVEQAWDGIALVAANGQILAVNSATCAMTGYSREDLLTMRVADLLAVPAEGVRSPLSEEALRAGEVVASERTVRRKDGTTFVVELAARQQDNGHVQAIIRDVTSRREAERALRESEERYRLLYRHLPLAYQSLEGDGTIAEVNEAWLALTGVTRQHAIGGRFDVLLEPESQLRFLESLAKVSRSREVRDVEVVLAGAGRVPVTLSIDLREATDGRGESRIHCVLHDVTAARAAAARLRESEERYRSLFADNPVPLFEEDFSGIRRHLDRLQNLGVADFEAHFAAHPDELADCVEAVKVVDVNKATLALYRAESRSQLLAGLDRIIGRDGHAVFEEAFLALARGERSWSSRGVNYTLDGDPLELALQWSLTPGAEADWSRVIVSAIDVSDRARAEEALRESDARFVRAFQSSPIPMAISTRANGRFLDVNDAFVAQFGWSRRELIGATSAQIGLFAQADTRERLLRLLTTEAAVQNQEATFRDKSGRLVEVLCSGVPLPLDGEDCLLVQMVNVGGWKHAVEAGRESERMLATLMSNLPGMVYQCCNDPEFTMLFVSEGCREVTGYEPGDLVGNRRVSYANLIVEEDRETVRAEVQKAVAEGRPFRLVYRIAAAGGDTRWVWEQGRVGQVTAGDVITLEGFIADITDRKRAEEELRASTEQLRQAQKMEAVGRLAGGVAHDFNNVLTAILGFADIVLTHLAPGDPASGRVEEIRRAGERAASLTRQLLAFSRRQVLAPQVVALDAVVRHMAPMLARLIGEDIQLSLAGDGGHVKADPSQLEQVLLNMAVNARDAMPRGGTLTIETSRTVVSEQEARETGLPHPGSYVVLRISDTGLGMDEATRLRLFEPFFTTKPEGEGTGLGLSAVYGIVQQSEGAIAVESVPGEGTTFRIYLPGVEGADANQERDQAPFASAGGIETVLIVEDEEPVRRLMRSVLERHGHTVLEAADGVEGLEVFERDRERLDLLMTDVVMPRMDGPRLIEHVLALRPLLPVVYLSGYSEEAVRTTGMPGDGVFLQKPFTSLQLLKAVRQALDRAAGKRGMTTTG